MNTLADQYYVKAMDNYPFALEEAIESLNYALSYDNEHVGANCLMGKIHVEQFNDPARAESFFKAALASDPYNQNVCLEYALMLINNREFEKAERVIEFVLGFNNADLAKLYHLVGALSEYQHQYDKAIEFYEDALLEAYNDEVSGFLNGEIKRVQAKQKLKNKPARNNNRGNRNKRNKRAR